jgi:hypothetical protein
MMKYLSYLTLAALLSIIAAWDVQAAEVPLTPWRGNQWVEICKSKSVAAVFACNLYTRGVADGIMVRENADENTDLVCIDPKIRTHQLIDVANEYINNNPKTRHEWVLLLLAKAFFEAWPCKQHNPV